MPFESEQVTAQAAAEHRVTTSERGSFSSARCACGWRGPARRARSKAREDALHHHSR
ncbi:hypothetical protein GL263_18100 [Streptomyces durbertensis]|uniref:Uncharacterized protein n=1 Tax=Streptomyces durbertensis TaxID=2448886 RepID=A0ABR6EKI6_9ACTN|nr:hypothetical protein [Streptomyces durbertensis]MBB1245460.1 hypothetical protein [Streptomyces durbertensis]